MTATMLVGDCRERLRELPDESVHCVISSPPYWGLRDYGTGVWEGGDSGCDHLQRVGGTDASTLGTASGGNAMSDEARRRATERSFVPFREVCGKCGARRVDHQLGLEPSVDEYVQALVEVFREVRRVLRQDGTVWLNIGDTYNAYNGNRGGARGLNGHADEQRNQLPAGAGLMAAGLKPKDLVMVPARLGLALQADGWYVRSDVIWSKPNPMPESVRDRPTQAHEHVFLLAKSRSYFYDADAVREPYAAGSVDRIQQGFKDRYSEIAAGGFRGAYGGPDGEQVHPAGRNKRSVWEVSTSGYAEAHFATFPTKLVEPCILAGCPVGGVVLDPFAGSGTVGVVCEWLGRDFIGIELSATYAEMARRRIETEGRLGRAAHRPEKPSDAQLALLELM